MMRARSLLVAAFVLVPINTVLAADATDKPTDATDCATLAATPATGTATDRFMREWCQRSASTAAPIAPSAPETATPPPAEIEALQLLADGVPRKSVGERMDPPVAMSTVVTYLNEGQATTSGQTDCLRQVTAPLPLPLPGRSKDKPQTSTHCAPPFSRRMR